MPEPSSIRNTKDIVEWLYRAAKKIPPEKQVPPIAIKLDMSTARFINEVKQFNPERLTAKINEVERGLNEMVTNKAIAPLKPTFTPQSEFLQTENTKLIQDWQKTSEQNLHLTKEMKKNVDRLLVQWIKEELTPKTLQERLNSLAEGLEKLTRAFEKTRTDEKILWLKNVDLAEKVSNVVIAAKGYISPTGPSQSQLP